MQSRKSRMLIWLLIGVCFRHCHSLVYDRPKIVTYGEPCVASRQLQLPVTIEGPKPPVEDQKIPLSLDLKVVSDMYAQPRSRRIEYPIAVDIPYLKTTTLSKEEIIQNEDTLRGKTYAYDTYLPPVGDTVSFLPSKKYNFQVNVPVSIKEITSNPSAPKYVERLKGLTTRVDRVLLPACEVSQSRGC
ncbi:uncharacterized protein LOC144475565 [Augochlora pura]